MSLDALDLFVVQKTAGTLAKVTAQDLNNYLESTGSVTYQGTADFGASLDDPKDKSQPLNIGDLYINSGDTDGPWDWDNGPAVTPDPVKAGDRAIWNGATWDYFTDGVQDAGVESITGGNAIEVTGTAAVPTVSAINATETLIGVVEIATDAEVTSGAVGAGHALVVTAAQLKATNDAISSAGGGTVTNVTAEPGSAISVTNNTSTPVIDVATANSTSEGVVRLATDAEAAAGIVTDAAVTPIQLAANVPSNLGVETIVETDDADAVTGAMIISGPDADGEVKIGVQDEVFCPFDFSTLDPV